MSEYIGENFQDFQDHTTYFLTQDALKPLEYDLAFSPTTKYYCGANCKVCYIKGKLQKGHPTYKDEIPDSISDKQTAKWYEVFEYFYTIRTNDDFTYLKKNYPVVFDWYREHANTFEFNMTDNAIISQQKVLMDDLNLKGLGDVSMSDHFLNRVNANRNYNKVMEILQGYMDKYGLCKIKIIRTDGELEDHVYELVDWLTSKGVKNTLQEDLRTDKNRRGGLNEVFDYQNTYIMNYNNKSYQIYREAIQLFGDRFFYSVDEASDITVDPFHYMTDEFSAENLITDMLSGKIAKYGKFASEIDFGQSDVIDKFKSYYINTNEVFTVNKDFNFIPSVMLNDNTKFYSKLIQNGYVKTAVGLYRPNGTPKPIITFKES
jgi:hypothetical protein